LKSCSKNEKIKTLDMAKRFFFMLTITILGVRGLSAQIPIGPVVDAPLASQNLVISFAEGLMNYLLKGERPLQDNIKNVQDFFFKAETVVNASIANMRMVRESVELQQEIMEMYNQAIFRLNQPLDGDADDVDDLEVIDKWRHIQVLLSTSVFELFTNLIEADAFTMNDKGRIRFIEKSYKDLIAVKGAMRAELRRINREVYSYRIKRREILTFTKLFE
jgi:hypothetical protein